MSAEAVRVRWNADHIGDLGGRHFVVTGGNSGLGLESVKALAAHGAKVTLACRDVAKGAAAIREIAGDITVKQIDLASLTSIRNFATEMQNVTIDVLINNAGVMAPPYAKTADGFEMQIGTNHLGHFALTSLLWDNLMKSDSPRVVTVASNAHRMGTINFDDMMSSKKYSAWSAYGQSKLANLLFKSVLAVRGAKVKSNFKSIAAHPGYSATNLSMSVAPTVQGPIRRFTRAIESVIAQDASMGALPQLYAAVAEEVPNGAYVGPDGWGEWRGYPKLVSGSKKSKDFAVAEKLWAVSEELTGINFL